MGRSQWRGSAAHPVISVEDGKTLLRVDGIIQSVALNERHKPDIWDALIPDHHPESALILGLGGGTVASLLTRRFGAIPIVGVERDARIARMARDTFGINALENVQIVVEDAFAFMPRCEAHFDLICVDLYVAGKLEHGVLGGEFLRQISRALTVDGIATFNLWDSPYLDDQIRRLSRAVAIENVREVGGNVVVMCRRRPLVTVLPR